MNRRSILAVIILVIVKANRNWWDAADLGNTIYTLKYSRKREKEADMTGIDLCLAAGQSPAGLVTTMKKLLRIEDENGGSPPRILATHPATKDRVDYLTKRCLEVGVKAADLDPKYPDESDRIGSIVTKGKKKKNYVVTVDATRELKQDETVWIKKPLWDDEKNAVVPQPIAKGTVSMPGIKATIVVTKEPGFEFEDIEIGGGIYPRAP
jgi:predicted Zn-dependent protease